MSTPSPLFKTYGDIRKEVARFLGWGIAPADWSTDQKEALHRCVNDGMMRFLYPEAVGDEPAGYRWSFLEPVAQLTLAADDDDYTLPQRVGAIRGNGTLLDSTQAYRNWPQVVLTNEARIRRMRSDSDHSGRPEYMAVRPVNLVPSDDTALVAQADQTFELLLYPTPDDTYSLLYPYSERYTEIGAGASFGYADDNSAPPGGPEHSLTIQEAALAEAESTFDDNRGLHEEKFMRHLLRSIKMDKSKRTPDSLGIMGTGERVVLSRDRGNGVLMYNGVEIT